MPATDLIQALNTLSPIALNGEDLNLYYVPHPNKLLDRMETKLRAEKRLKLLFTGHRISGKTTALNALTKRLQDAFFIVNFSVLDSLNAHDVHDGDSPDSARADFVTSLRAARSYALRHR